MNNTNLPSYITDINEMQKHLSLDLDSIRDLNLDRGEQGSHQTTVGLVNVLKKNESYLFKSGFFKKVEQLYTVDLEKIENSLEIPAYLEINAIWDNTSYLDCENLFGSTSRLYVSEEFINIPKVKATDLFLKYYGACIIPEDVPVQFPSDEFPIFMMSVGENRFRHGIQNDIVGGVFLEYHYDQPHFHMVYDEGSYYILAKWSDETKRKLQITAFELPVNKGVYTKKGVIHCDSAIKGTFLNGYMLTNDFSVAYLRTNIAENKRVKVDIL